VQRPIWITNFAIGGIVIFVLLSLFFGFFTLYAGALFNFQTSTLLLNLLLNMGLFLLPIIPLYLLFKLTRAGYILTLGVLSLLLLLEGYGSVSRTVTLITRYGIIGEESLSTVIKFIIRAGIVDFFLIAGLSLSLSFLYLRRSDFFVNSPFKNLFGFGETIFHLRNMVLVFVLILVLITSLAFFQVKTLPNLEVVSCSDLPTENTSESITHLFTIKPAVSWNPGDPTFIVELSNYSELKNSIFHLTNEKLGTNYSAEELLLTSASPGYNYSFCDAFCRVVSSRGAGGFSEKPNPRAPHLRHNTSKIHTNNAAPVLEGEREYLFYISYRVLLINGSKYNELDVSSFVISPVCVAKT
jgi:hypothetical protein